ncbi:MAG: BamA/TamA family outer membrane protein [bacterium]|nr:BamA/TamA family outer membrane protein [bacterium]
MFGRDNIQAWLLSLLVSSLLSLFFTTCDASAVEYKDYKSSKTQVDYFSIAVDNNRFTLSVFEEKRTITAVVDRADIVVGTDRVELSDDAVLEEDALLMDGVRYPYDRIYGSKLFGTEEGKREILFTRKTSDSKASRSRRGNLISFADKIVVQEGEFIRGLVLSITGDIEIYGEINQDVVTLFGEVYVGTSAVIRGDITSLAKGVELARDASIYGEVYSDKKKKFGRRKFARDKNAFSLDGDCNYNRVDGASLTFTGSYKDIDSLLPSLWASAGYGFASERWRYEFGIEQTLLRAGRLGIGARFYRQLASGDDWLLSDNENMVFTLLVTEDFKDYYEAEGGSVYLNFSPWQPLKFEAAYTQEETMWLEAHNHLWSLFGGDKLFGDNFGRVPQTYREASILEIDSTTNAFLTASLSYNSRKADEGYSNSSWAASASFEWSNDDLQSDFDYRRYQIHAARYQKVNRRATFMLSGRAGFSDGYLPMYKRYYLGGLGTLRGYYHKEQMGSRFWMANAEYKVDFPGSDLGISVFWDGGQIANDTKLSGDIDVKQDVGFGIYIDDDFIVTLAKRMDSAENDNPKIYVRFDNIF